MERHRNSHHLDVITKFFFKNTFYSLPISATIRNKKVFETYLTTDLNYREVAEIHCISGARVQQIIDNIRRKISIIDFSVIEGRNLTFEQLPSAVQNIGNQLEEIKSMMLDSTRSIEKEDEIFTVQEAAEFLKLSVPTIYSKTSKNEIPFNKRGKRLYFSKFQLEAYIRGE